MIGLHNVPPPTEEKAKPLLQIMFSSCDKPVKSPLHPSPQYLIWPQFIRMKKTTGQIETKSRVVNDFRLHEKDTGSADVQIALLTERINRLTEHLQKNNKDHSSRRGLLMMVGQRRKLLDYLHTTDAPRYQAVTRKLKLRK